MIATLAVALSLAVMIIATAVLFGFNNQISAKIHGFWGHVQVKSFDANRSLENIQPISTNTISYKVLDTISQIHHVQVFAHKPSIIQKDGEIEGIVFKGIGQDFNWDFFSQYLVDGTTIEMNDSMKSKKIVVSKTTSDRLNLGIGDDLLAMFVRQGQSRPYYRKFEITGIYNTGLAEFDRYYALVDIRHIQKVQDWKSDEVGGYEVFLHDPDEIDGMTDRIYYEVLEPNMVAQSIKEIYPNIFDWLSMHRSTVLILISLLALVAGINMITALLILILERTSMIGVMKSLGASNWSIRKIFLYNAAIIIGVGLLLGNILGIGLSLLQLHFGIVKLPPESYYLAVAPIEFNVPIILLINFCTFIFCLLMLFVPSYLVSKVDPIKAIRFS